MSVTIGGLNQDRAMALLEVHSQRIESGSWPERMHAERGQPNRIEAFEYLIAEGILDKPANKEEDVLRITPKGRDTLYGVLEVLTNSV